MIQLDSSFKLSGNALHTRQRCRRNNAPMVKQDRATAAYCWLLTLVAICCTSCIHTYAWTIMSTAASRSTMRTRSRCFLSARNSSSSVDAQSSNEEVDDSIIVPVETIKSADTSKTKKKKMIVSSRDPRRLDLMWCQEEYCKDAVRERVGGRNNQIYLNGPATGQVAYHWSEREIVNPKEAAPKQQPQQQPQNDTPPTVLLLIKPGDEDLLRLAAEAVQNLTSDADIRILLDPSTAARLKYYHGVDDDKHIRLFEIEPTPGFGSGLCISDASAISTGSDGLWTNRKPQQYAFKKGDLHKLLPNTEYLPDLICTLGGDGLLMHASMIFQGPVPPILCIAGGSLGFLTPFRPDEMVDAIKVALGLETMDEECNLLGGGTQTNSLDNGINVYPPNMPSYPYDPIQKASGGCNSYDDDNERPRFSFGRGGRICLSIRMRLECTIISREGTVRARYNVLNEVVIDRGSSPYLAALECFCDDVHLTTVQADGVIFATPTGSTAYSLAAGSSVVHPAVPCILVTPICPHVLSFRSMVFADHVVLRCYVPDDARAIASVAFDGKHRQELSRGDSVQVRMSCYPVPTINREDHSADWLGSLKRNFNFNSRARQRPL